MKYFLNLALALCLTGSWMAAAQSEETAPAGAEMGGYTSMSFDAGYFQSSLDGKIEIMKEGVKIILHSKDASEKPLPINANQVRFTWPEKGTHPSKIVLEGKVLIEHPKATIRSEKADWDFETGVLTFTGSPVASMPQVQELRGEKLVLNFKTNKFEVVKGAAKEVPLNGGAIETVAGPSNPYLLREQDILDWSAFLGKFKEQADAKEPSPGKRTMSLLSSKAQKQIGGASKETLLSNKAGVLKELNNALLKPSLYDEAAWKNVTLDADTQALLSKKPSNDQEAAQLNRALLEAAFTGLIAKSPKD